MLNMKDNLTKREYLGVSYVNNFINEQGEIKSVFCTKQEYENSGFPNLDGYKFLNAQGEVMQVDTGLLKENEYTIVDGKYFVCLANEYGIAIKEYSEEEFNNLWQ